MKTKQLTLSALFIALGLTIPMVFHMFNMAGNIFLPMHIPVLIGAMFLGAEYGLIIGIITPILSSVLTGMPPTFPMLPIMILELGTYGFVSGLLTQKFKLNIYLSLVIAMIMGRISAGIVVYLLGIFTTFDKNPLIFVKASIVVGIPGILIQLILIPAIVKLLEKATRRSYKSTY